MDNSSTITDFLGKGDRIIPYNSKWPIFRLSVFDNKGLWRKFKTKLNVLSENNKLHDIDQHQLINYYDENPEIEFEVYVFNELMQKHHLMNINNSIYSYSWGIRTKNTKNIAYVRFYFDVKDFILT